MTSFFLWALAKLDARASWVQLARLRNSFLSKALTAFSLATFGLSNFGEPLHRIGVDISPLRWTFVGSILFLIGYIIVSLRVPPEFRETGDVFEIADRMSKIDSLEFFKSRLRMTNSLLDRISRRRHSGQLNAPIEYARQQVLIAKSKNEKDWEDGAINLYHSDVVLRQYDRPFGRALALSFLFVGICILLSRTTIAAVKAILGLFS